MNALKVVSMRIRGTASELEAAGEETDGVIENVSKLQEKIQALTGVNILDETGAYKDTYTILYEIGKEWKNLDDLTQASTLEILAGKTRGSAVAAILQNYELVQKAYEAASHAEGSALTENEKYLESIQGRIDIFTNAVQTMWMDLIESDLVTGFVDMGTKIIEILDSIINKVGSLGTILGALAVGGAFNLTGKIAPMFAQFSELTDKTKGFIDLLSGSKEAKDFLSGHSMAQILFYAQQTGQASAGIQVLTSSFKALFAVMKPLLIAAAAVAVIGGIAKVINDNITTHEEYVEQLKNTSEELENTRNELSTVNSELETTQDRIKELQKLANEGTITPIEETELKLLKAQNDELDRQRLILEAREKRQEKEKAKNFIGAVQSDGNLTNSYIPTQKSMKFDLGVLFGGGYKNTESELDQRLAELQTLKDDLDQAEAALLADGMDDPKLQKAVEKAQKKYDNKLNDIEEIIAGYDDLLNTATYYYAEDGKALEDWQIANNEAYKKVADAQDKYLIQTASSPADRLAAEQNYIKRLFGAQGSDSAQWIASQAQDVDATQREIGLLINSDRELVSQLREMNIGADEAAGYLLYLAESARVAAEEEAKAAEAAVKFAAAPKGYSTLISQLDAYNTAQALQNELLYDNIGLTEDQYNSLLDFVGDETKLGEVIDKENGYLLKNADALRDLIDKRKAEVLANTKLSKSQAKLRYTQLVKELNKAVKANSKYNTSAKDSVASLLDQIDSVEHAIERYETLEDQMLGVTSAFDKFEEAKEIDAETDYVSQMLEMFEVLNEGFETSKVASESFMAAMDAWVPKDILAGLDDTDKLDKAYEYLKGILDKYITLDDGEISIGFDNIKKFVQDAIDKDLLTGTTEDFQLVPGVDHEAFAKELKVTKEMVYAMFDELSNYEVGGTNLNFALDSSITGQIEQATKALAEATEDYWSYVENASDGNAQIFDRLHKLSEKYNEYTNGNLDYNKRPIISPDRFKQYYPDADVSDGDVITTQTQTWGIGEGEYLYTVNVTPIDENGNILDQNELLEYINNLDVLNGIDGLLASDEKKLVINVTPGDYDEEYWEAYENRLDEIKDAHADLLNQLSETEYAEYQTWYSLQEDMQTAEDNLDNQFQKASDAALAYHDMNIQLAALYKSQEENGRSYELDQQIASVQKQIDTFKEANDVPYVVSIAVDVLDDDIASAEKEIARLTLLNKQGVYGAQIQELEKYVDEQTKLKQELTANYLEEDATVEESLEFINEYKIGDKEFKVAINSSSYRKLIEQLKALSDIDTIEVDVQSSGSSNKIIGGAKSSLLSPAFGVADANGTPSTSTPIYDALTGELGRELVVDPHSGRYYTVGDNGAEMVDLPKDAIVFNHQQTEDLLKNGHISSRGKALVSGNAFAGNSLGLRDSQAIYDTDTNSDSDSDTADEFEETIDFIEIKLQELADVIDDLNAKLENAVGYEEQNRIVGDLILGYEDQMAGITSAITAYLAKAQEEFAKIPDAYKDMAQNGAFEVKDFVGEGNEEVVKAINNYREWSDKVTELNLQLEETKAEIISLAKTKIDNIVNQFENLTSLLDASTSEIESEIELIETKGLNVTAGYYEELIKLSEERITQLQQEQQALEEVLATEIEAGNITVGSDAFYESRQAIDDVKQSVADGINQIAEYKAEIADLEFNNITEDYDRLMIESTAEKEAVQAHIDLLESKGEYLSSHSYGRLLELEERELILLQQKRSELKRVLDEQVELGNVDLGSDAYFEMVEAIYDVDSAIDDATASMEEFQNSINDLHWENFDKLLTRLGYVDSEIGHIYELVSDEKAVDDEGNWTDEGITALAMQAQAMESARYRAEQYAEQIEELERTKDRYSDEEYTTKLYELTEGQWESIEAYEAAKDAIIDLNSTRIDAVKDGIQKQIDAYEELIKLTKEELNAQKKLHDFQNSISDQSKTVADLERQIAARAGSTDAATVAERKQLEAELLSAKEDLNNLYYDNALTMQEEALDDELDAYNKTKDAELTTLESTLEDIESLIASSLDTVLVNTDVVVSELNQISDEYGINLSDALTRPWSEGSYAIDSYTGHFLDASSAFIDELDLIKDHWEELQKQADDTARSMLEAINQEVESVPKTSSKLSGSSKSSQDDDDEGHINLFDDDKDDTSSYSGAPIMDYNEFFGIKDTSSGVTYSSEEKASVQPKINDLVTVKKTATEWSRDGGNGTKMHSWVPGSKFYVRRVEGDDVLLSTAQSGAYTGWVRIKDLEGYAKGTSGVKDNQWAWLDEIGEEIVLNAGKNGRLQYLTKGSAVIPHDISENLMKIGQLDPTEAIKRSSPVMSAPGLIDAGLALDMSFGSLVHVDTVTEDTLPKLQSMVRDEFNTLMKSVNSGLKKYTR